MINQNRDLFEFNRFHLLILSIVFTRSRPVFLYLGIFSGLVVFSALLRPPVAYASSFHDAVFNILLFLGGFLLSSNAFNEFDETHSKMDWLLLPCSIFEKYLAKLLLTSIIFSVSALIFYSFFSYLVEELYFQFFDFSHPVFSPFNSENISKLRLYIILQPTFLMGAIYFRKHVFIKTIFVLWLFIAAFTLLVIFGFKTFYWGNIFEFIGDQQQFIFQIDSESPLPGPLSWLKQAVYVFFWYGMAPFFWWCGYRRLSKIEA